MSTLPLEGVKVLDLSRWIAGPSCAMILADLGADVVKVEPLSGEVSRNVGPRTASESVYTLTYNRNKRALALDTRHASSRDVLRRLSVWADVLVENYRPGTMERMGLGSETLTSWNANLIHVAISGYAGRGAHPDRPLFNAVAEAESGAMMLTGDTEVGPVVSGTFQADHAAGLHAAIAALAALYGRREGNGVRRADVSLFHSMLAVSGFSYTGALNGLAPDANPINRDKLAAPGNAFRTVDGRYIYIDAGTDSLYRGLVNAMGAEERLGHTLDIDADDRNRFVDEIEAEISRWTGSITAAALIECLDAAGIPHGVVRAIEELGANEELLQGAAVHTLDDGTTRVPGSELAFDGELLPFRRRPPRVGEHTHEILAEVCGFGEAEIAGLLAEGVTR